MEKLLISIKKLLPKKIFRVFQPIYHYAMTIVSVLIYRFPSKKIKVIGVTGTKGKSSVVEILASILEEAGYKVASQSTVRFKIGNEIQKNLFKMTMPGRFFIQKFLREAVEKKCDFALIEMTSEGTKQFRHKFIDLDALIFTNLAPEHIESHGGYEKYRDAKLKIAESLSKSSKKEKFMVGNADDKETHLFFEKAKHTKIIPYSLSNVEPWKTKDDGIEFIFEKQKITSPLRGKFNIYNAVSASTLAHIFGVKIETIKKALAKISEIPGRVESIKTNDFEIIVDYAHTPDSLKALYETFHPKDQTKNSCIIPKKLICVLGNTGGGRDTWKRPEMGKIANEYCDEIILTNEDPYDEDPKKIVDEMAIVIEPKKLVIEMDRKKAINMAIKKARQIVSEEKNKCVVLVTGKGTDPYIMESNGKKTPWSDANIVKEELKNEMF